MSNVLCAPRRLARIGRSELVSAWHRFLSSASTHLLALEERHGDEGAAEGLLVGEGGGEGGGGRCSRGCGSVGGVVEGL